jgi:hypothetical protein
MEDLIKELEHFFENENNLYFWLRHNKGLNEESLVELLELLDRIGGELRGETMIEKRLAFLLTGVAPYSMYFDVQPYSQSELDRIFHAQDALMSKIEEILS